MLSAEGHRSLDVVVVNWNAGDQLSRCVNSVLENAPEELSRLIVVDNGSLDGSVEGVATDDRVRVLRAGSNLGFAAACNLGARHASAAYILFLNPDTIIGSRSLREPIAFMESPAGADAAICGIQLIDQDGEIARSCARFPRPGMLIARMLGVDRLPGLKARGMRMGDWDHRETRTVDQVMGAFFFVRRSVFDQLGGFDERFFMYFEEVDFSYRARNAGWRSVYLAGARAFHFGGGTSQQVKACRLFYSLRSRLLYGFKHFPRWQAWSVAAVTVVVEPVTRIAWHLSRGDIGGVCETRDAFRWLWGGLRRIARGDGRFVT
ncbi:glycosyltransferase family 2 protein [Thioalkalivibrio sp. ALE11]|uniref:glycosyltransferase family 2 protein n=1 Tax=Thioalkalivibrio sp. ALE11 TaxID=1265494 RepID=UPI0003694625|nr:glycosyltransferase family 2 protein [Thioalkalivibrio sp. ALE11]